MKKKILILFKAPYRWNIFVINKLNKFYDVDYLYLSKMNTNYIATINEINTFIEKKKIEIVFFDVDYQKFVHLFFIRKIKNVKKIMFTPDDYERHNLNSITAGACNMVLCCCPIASLKYSEKGYTSYFWPLESDSNILKDLNQIKTIDVLFFGRLNQDREEYINYIKSNNIKIEVAGNDDNMSYENLVSLINKSKIILNFSKSTWGSVNSIRDRGVFKFFYQFKGRVIEAGLCGCACVSEYAPQYNLLFSDNELLQFKNKEECVKILKDLLNNPEKLKQYTNNFRNKVTNFFEDQTFFKRIYNEIEKDSVIGGNLIRVPYWYLRIAAKQILIRNINILNFKGTVSNLLEVLTITKTSKIYIRAIILIESLLNFLWYGIKGLLKLK